MFRITRLTAALLVALACLPAHAGQRSFVSSTGNDSNAASGCTPALPCRSFQAAHDAVDAGGEVVALDTAGFGAVVISKSVAIIGNPGAIASISVASGEGVLVNMAGVEVVLRNLNINGVGGTNGITLLAGSSLTIENCVVSNFTYTGINILAYNTTPQVRIADTVSRGNVYGILVSESADLGISRSHLVDNEGIGLYVSIGSGATDVAVNDTVVSGSSTGIYNHASGTAAARMSLIRVSSSNNSVNGIHNIGNAPAGVATVTLGSSMVVANGRGLENQVVPGGTATFESLGNNIVRINNSANMGTITPIAGS